MATTAGAKKGLWSTIRRIAASDRISGLIMLGFALTGLVLANLPATAHAFETVAETHLFIPYTNLDLPIGHWTQDGLLMPVSRVSRKLPRMAFFHACELTRIRGTPP